MGERGYACRLRLVVLVLVLVMRPHSQIWSCVLVMIVRLCVCNFRGPL